MVRLQLNVDRYAHQWSRRSRHLVPRVPLRMETIVTSETRRPAASFMVVVPDAPAAVEWYKKEGIHNEFERRHHR